MRPRRRVRAQRAVQRRHAPARRDGDRAGVPRRDARRAARSSTSPRAAITPTSAASRRARCRPIRRTSRRRACCSTTCSWSRRGASSKPRCARSSARAAIPSRNLEQNLADLRAQVAACAKGVDGARADGRALRPAGRARLHAARAGQRRGSGAPRARRADGRPLRIRDGQRREDRRHDPRSTARGASATIDFTGTSAQQPTNFNAPSAVCKAAVLYVFRTLVDDEIPMNAGLPEAARDRHSRGLDARARAIRRRSSRATSRPRRRSPMRSTARSACWPRRRAR